MSNITYNINLRVILETAPTESEKTNRKLNKIMASIQDLQAEVEAETTVKDSVLALIDRLVANQNDPVALDKLLTDMKANKQAIVDSVVKNTSAENT